MSNKDRFKLPKEIADATAQLGRRANNRVKANINRQVEKPDALFKALGGASGAIVQIRQFFEAVNNFLIDDELRSRNTSLWEKFERIAKTGQDPLLNDQYKAEHDALFSEAGHAKAVDAYLSSDKTDDKTLEEIFDKVISDPDGPGTINRDASLKVKFG